MSLLTSVHLIEKTMGTQKLFQGLSFGIHHGQRIGLLGPNGSGKSTLLKILAGEETVDSGDVSAKKSLSVAYVPQDEVFEKNLSVQAVAEKTLSQYGLAKDMAQVQAAIYLSMVGFEDTDVMSESLSGGWRKRLSLAIAFAKDADLMLIDEPTNHLDWEGILWLENQLKTFSKAFIVVSHDREFLQNQCDQYMEINRLYKDGFFSLQCSYDEFLQRKEDYIAAQMSQQESMSNKARREVDWLRAGVKARTTKSSSRIKEAHQLLDDLSEVKQRNSSAKAKINIAIESGGKRSKKFLEAKNLNIAYGSKKILTDLNLLLGPRTRIGLLGDNASGKTSLLKVLAGLADNYTGELFRAENLKIVYFDQKREGLDPKINITEFLGDGSDHVEFRGRSLHVASYGSQFLFDAQKMSRPIGKLSGGEQARLLIAKLLLQPADLLILDEPTNDLDIATIEMLEESLQDFAGLVLIVSHDRYFLNGTCHRYLGLDGQGGWENYADLKQWLTDRSKSPAEKQAALKKTNDKEQGKKSTSKVKLSYKEKRFLETIETDIEVAEANLKLAQESLDQNTNFSDHLVMQNLLEDLQIKQKQVESLYATWAEIEAKGQ